MFSSGMIGRVLYRLQPVYVSTLQIPKLLILTTLQILYGRATGLYSTGSSSGTSLVGSCVTQEASSARLLLKLHNLPSNGFCRPSRGAEPFISVIVKAPIIQIMVIIVSLITLMVELPAPFIKGTSIYRSWTLRIVLLIFQAFLGVLLYQVRASLLTLNPLILTYVIGYQWGPVFANCCIWLHHGSNERRNHAGT